MAGQEVPGVAIGFGVPDGEEQRVAEILYAAFHHKLRPIFGSRELAVELIKSGLMEDRIVVASRGGRAIAVAALKFAGREPLDLGLWRLARRMNLGFIRIIFLGFLLFGGAKEDEMLLDMLAVEEEERGRGVGGAVVGFVAEEARRQGLRGIRLHVIGKNERARSFYERLGFRVVGYRNLIPLSLPMGFRGAHEMRLELGQD